MRKKQEKVKPPETWPHFSSEDEEREFWATHDTTPYVDRQKAIVGIPLQRLRAETMNVSLRLPKAIVNDIKRIAGGIDIGYQALIKVWLDDRLRQERQIRVSG